MSILLPVYDAAATLDGCIRSIRRQTWADWECIAVDDGSGDGSAVALDEVAAADRRFTVIHAPHRGLVPALNAGLACCRGAYVARMDADDLMHRDRLRAQQSLLEADPGVSAVGCHVRMFPRDALGPGRREYERWLNGMASPRQVREEAFVECPVAHPGLMIRRAILVALGYRDCAWPEDYDLVLRLLIRGHEVGMVPRRLLCWRHVPARLSLRSPAYAIERFTACKAAFLAQTFLAGSETYVLWGYGSTGRALSRALRRFGRRASHIVEVHPGRIGQTIQEAAVIPPERLPELPRRPLVVSVAGAAPRAQVRAALRAMGLRELDDFVCAA